MVEDGHRQDLGFSRNVAANHQHHPEFTHGVGEGQYRGGQKARSRQRNHNREKTIPGRSPQGGGGLQQALVDGQESSLQGLDGKGQGIDNRRQHQAFEGKEQESQPEVLHQAAQGTVRAHNDQQVKPSTVGGSTSGSATTAETGWRSQCPVRASHQAMGVPITSSSAVVMPASFRVSQTACHSGLMKSPPVQWLGCSGISYAASCLIKYTGSLARNNIHARAAGLSSPWPSKTACCLMGVCRSFGTSHREPSSSHARVWASATNPATALPVATNWKVWAMESPLTSAGRRACASPRFCSTSMAAMP